MDAVVDTILAVVSSSTPFVLAWVPVGWGSSIGHVTDKGVLDLPRTLDPETSIQDLFAVYFGWSETGPPGITDELGNLLPHKDPWVSAFYWAVTTMSTM